MHVTVTYEIHQPPGDWMKQNALEIDAATFVIAYDDAARQIPALHPGITWQITNLRLTRTGE